MASITDRIAKFFNGTDTDTSAGLQGLFVNELKGIYYTEKQLIDALAEQADAATSDEVRDGFLKHREETINQVARLERVFDSIGETADEMTCEAADGLVADARTVVSNTESGSLTRDAGLIIASQKVEHHEIAVYGSLHTLARVLGYNEAANLIEQNLQEEKNTDQKLTQLAESFVNQQAASESTGMGNTSGSYSADSSYGTDTMSNASTAYGTDSVVGGSTYSASKATTGGTMGI
jgi:ferritin-like metal-binding protein YciE